MKKQTLLAAAVGVALAAATTAQAQSIDYGSLQQMFNEPVTTSATGSPLRSTDVPVDMTIITSDDIKRSGATDLPTILSRVPGIDILSWSAQDTDVGVRGYNQAYSPRLLVLINGRQVYLDHYGYTNWANLPVSLGEIRQIEVVRGPNSALFGFNAVGGVVNIITFNPKYDKTGSADVHGGTQDGVGGSLVETLHLKDRLSLRLSAGGERQNEWENSSAFPMVWNAHAAADGVLQISPTTELRVEGTFSRNHDLDYLVTYSGAESLYTTSSVKTTLSSDTHFGQFQAQAYVNDLQNSSSGQVGTLDFKNQVEVATLQDLFKLGTRSTIRIALEYRDNRINTSNIGGAHVSYDVWSPSAMWNFAATPKLSVTVAGRVDALSLSRTGSIAPFLGLSNSDWNKNLSEVSVNAGAVYKLTALDGLRASYARGVQVPTLTEFGGFQSLIPHFVAFQGNVDLRPAIVSNYEISYDRDLPPLGAKATAKAFFQTTADVKGQWDPSDAVAPASPGALPLAEYENVGSSTMTGVELAAKGNVKSFHWSADTTYTNVAEHTDPIYSPINRHVEFNLTTPKFRGNVAGGWSNTRWTVDAYVHYVSDYQMYTGATLTPVAGYVTLAGRIAYTLHNGLVIALSGQNLGTDHQIQSGPTGLKAPRRVLLGISKTW